MTDQQTPSFCWVKRVPDQQQWGYCNLNKCWASLAFRIHRPAQNSTHGSFKTLHSPHSYTRSIFSLIQQSGRAKGNNRANDIHSCVLLDLCKPLQQNEEQFTPIRNIFYIFFPEVLLFWCEVWGYKDKGLKRFCPSKGCRFYLVLPLCSA